MYRYDYQKSEEKAKMLTVAFSDCVYFCIFFISVTKFIRINVKERKKLFKL